MFRFTLVKALADNVIQTYLTSKAFISPSRQSRMGIKIVLTNIRNGASAVVASGFQHPFFSFYANSSDSRLMNSIALASQKTILRKSRFQFGNQNNQGQRWFRLIGNHDCNRQKRTRCFTI